MTIPLSKLVNINNIYAEGSGPFTQEGYETIRQLGDQMERGKAEGISLQDVQKFREICWKHLTAHYVRYLNRLRSEGETDGGTASLSIAMLFLQQLGIEVNESNIAEYVREVGKRINDPSLPKITVK